VRFLMFYRVCGAHTLVWFTECLLHIFAEL
jgi:hypothetical protein